MTVDERQVRQNQNLLREVNGRIAAISAEKGSAASEFVCECGRPGCETVIELDLTEHQQVKAKEDHFITALGHCVEGVDRKIEERQGFDVVVQI